MGRTANDESACNCSEVSSERRTQARTATVFRPVLFDADGLVGFCLVRNLAPGGLMGTVYTSFVEGTQITCQFHADKSVEGTIVWSRDGQIGIEFTEQIDVDRVLSDLARHLVEGKVNRAPRVPIQCGAELSIGYRILSAEVQDISQRGIKVAVSNVEPGDEVQLRLQGLEPRKAQVRWTRTGTAGLNFVRPLSFDELARWVIEQQSRSAASSEIAISRNH